MTILIYNRDFGAVMMKNKKLFYKKYIFATFYLVFLLLITALFTFFTVAADNLESESDNGCVEDDGLELGVNEFRPEGIERSENDSGIINNMEGFSGSAYSSDDNGFQGIINLTLPSELPFSLIIPQNGDTGFIYSDDFIITNNGDSSIIVELNDVFLRIEDKESFSISPKANLPDYGNNIHFILNIIKSSETHGFIIDDTPQTLKSFLINSGESIKLNITGTINERSHTAWEDTSIYLTVVFSTNNPSVS